MKPEIIKTGNKLTILPFKSRFGTTKRTKLDLSEYAGQYIRVWLDEDLTFSMDKRKNHHWQVAELQVPHQKHSSTPTGVVDDAGMPEFVSEKIPIELPTVKMFDIEILEDD